MHAKRRTMIGLMCAAATAVGLAALAAAAGKDEPARAGQQAMGRVSYDFARGGKWPGFYDARMTIRNPLKQRPLFVTGLHLDGKVRIQFADQEQVDLFAGEPIKGLFDLATTTGSFRILMDDYSAPDVGLDAFACTELLQREERPALLLVVDAIKQWTPGNNRKTKKGFNETFAVTLHGKLIVAKVTREGRGRNAKLTVEPLREVKLEKEGTVTFADAVSTSEAATPASMTLRATFEIDGKDLGLTGDDARALQVLIQCRGYTDFSDETKELLKDIKLDGPRLD